MLSLQVPKTEIWDYVKEEFVYVDGFELNLEHSLSAVSKWEQKYHKPFLEQKRFTNDEMLYYIRCMSLDEELPENFAYSVTPQIINEIQKYIEDPATATVITKKQASNGSGKFITSELIYYYMASLQIPFECDRWNINRLLTLIRIFDAENGKSKPMSKSEIYSENRRLNAMRRKAMNSKG